MIIFWCTYDFPMPPIETASRYNKHFSKCPTFTMNISVRTFKIWNGGEKKNNLNSLSKQESGVNSPRLREPVKCCYFEHSDNVEIIKGTWKKKKAQVVSNVSLYSEDSIVVNFDIIFSTLLEKMNVIVLVLKFMPVLWNLLKSEGQCLFFLYSRQIRAIKRSATTCVKSLACLKCDACTS